MVGVPKVVAKRRRVSFADDVVEVPDRVGNGERSRGVVHGLLRDAPLADVSGAAGIPEHSLLDTENGRNGDGTVTAFDIAEDIEEGAVVTRDGVIPAVLQRRVLTEADANAASSSDEDDNMNMPEKDVNDAWADRLATMPVSASTAAPKNDAKRRRTGAAALSLAQCVARFSHHLRHGETAARAMRRLKRDDGKEALDSLIDACHTALTLGVLGVYDAPREQLQAAVKWDLRWGETPADDVETHGKLEAAQMTAWEGAGYFSGARKAWVRPHDAVDVPWMSAKETFGGHEK